MRQKIPITVYTVQKGPEQDIFQLPDAQGKIHGKRDKTRPDRRKQAQSDPTQRRPIEIQTIPIITLFFRRS